MPEHLLESRKANVPEPLVLAEPLIGPGKRLRIEAAEMGASTHRPLDEPRTLERLHVLGRGRERHAIWLGQLAHSLLASCELLEHTAAGAVPEGAKDEIELGIFNHVAEYMSRPRIVNPLVEYTIPLVRRPSYNPFNSLLVPNTQAAKHNSTPPPITNAATVPDPPATSVPELYLRFALYILAAAGSFFALELFLKETAFKLTTVYGALAFNYYYWFTAPLFLGNFLHPVPDPLIWSIRLLVFGMTAVWVSRSYIKEELFVTQSRANKGAVVSIAAGRPRAVAEAGEGRANSQADGQGDTQQGTPAVTFQPGDKRVEVEQNSTLLEVAEAHGLPIEASCRMGVCGADPVCIKHGMKNLSPMTEDEKSTIERLGLAASTRLACSARIMGPVTVGLKPERAGSESASERTGVGNDTPTPAASPGFKFDPAVTKVVIIGNGIAGVTTADYLHRYHPGCEIHLIGREEHNLYNRMGIARLIYGRSAMQGLYLQPEAWYEEHNITTWLNTTVTRIDREHKAVLLGTGEKLIYDRLVLATGSSSTIPPIERSYLPGTFVLRKAADAIGLRAYAQSHGARRALVAGGGLLGLEAAYALHKLGLSVGVLERSDRLLRRQLDKAGSRLLRSYLESTGIEVIPNAECRASQGRGQLQEVVLKDGRTLGCDVLLVAAGITPNSGMAEAAGLKIKKGVVVDDGMRTSDPSIWAVGDVAEHRGQIYGLWQAAIDQAKAAAENIAGGSAEYSGTIPVTALKVVGIDVASMGRFEATSEEDIEIVQEDTAENRYRKLVISEGKLVGAILIGYPRDVPTVSAAVKGRADVSTYLDQLRSGNWSALAEARYQDRTASAA